MATNPPPRLSYSAALSSGTTPSTTTPQRQQHTSPPAQQPQRQQPQQQQQQQPPSPHHRSKRSPSPAHKPNTHGDNEPVYILTLQTSAVLHASMTALRKKYFPHYLNKLDAHLTLFHALPESQLQTSVLPTLRKVAAETARFELHCPRPFRLKKGIAISVDKACGGAQAQAVHHALLSPWKEQGWLSEQDSAAGVRVHYTIMNKVDDEAVVAQAMEVVQREFEGKGGEDGWAEGLGLWRYERGWWRWVEGFEFRGT